MLFRARVWSLGKLLLLISALVATFVLFALIGMRVAVRASEVQRTLRLHWRATVSRLSQHFTHPTA